MRRDLAGKRVILTGATGGIGRNVAEKLAAAGAKLVLAARSAGKLDALADRVRERGGEAVAVPADVTVPGDRERVIDAAVSHFGGLDALVNNAGVASWGHFATSDEAVLRTVMEVNFFAAAEMVRLALPHLTAGRDPVVVNVASLCGRLGLPAWPEHSASKHALVGLSEGLRAEFARFGIDVAVVVPGITKADDLGRHLLRKEGKADLNFATATPPDRVADAVVRAVVTGRRETVVGTDATWLLRVNRIFPRLVRALAIRKVKKLYTAGPGAG